MSPTRKKPRRLSEPPDPLAATTNGELRVSEPPDPRPATTNGELRSDDDQQSDSSTLVSVSSRRSSAYVPTPSLRPATQPTGRRRSLVTETSESRRRPPVATSTSPRSSATPFPSPSSSRQRPSTYPRPSRPTRASPTFPFQTSPFTRLKPIATRPSPPFVPKQSTLPKPCRPSSSPSTSCEGKEIIYISDSDSEQDSTEVESAGNMCGSHLAALTGSDNLLTHGVGTASAENADTFGDQTPNDGQRLHALATGEEVTPLRDAQNVSPMFGSVPAQHMLPSPVPRGAMYDARFPLGGSDTALVPPDSQSSTGSTSQTVQYDVQRGSSSLRGSSQTSDSSNNGIFPHLNDPTLAQSRPAHPVPSTSSNDYLQPDTPNPNAGHSIPLAYHLQGLPPVPNSPHVPNSRGVPNSHGAIPVQHHIGDHFSGGAPGGRMPTNARGSSYDPISTFPSQDSAQAPHDLAAFQSFPLTLSELLCATSPNAQTFLQQVCV